MVSARKRSLQEEDGASQLPSPKPWPQLSPDLLHLRNMWQFACLFQWLCIFGGMFKMDNLDIDELEVQCLNPHSTVLQDIGLALLKYLSSHRGLTHELFDEYTKRQYLAKTPHMPNPFGISEAPAKFAEFSAFQKVRVLHQMTLFVMMNPEKLREKMAEQKDVEQDQTSWRIEPFGWDRQDRVYYVLDDNRVYRMTEPSPAPVEMKKNTRKARAGARRSTKRRRASYAAVSNDDNEIEPPKELDVATEGPASDNDDGRLGGMKWECIVVSLDDLRDLLALISSKKDANERVLRQKFIEHLLPLLEEQEERRKRREKEREREMLNMTKMATAKRSSRIASRQKQQKVEEAQREEEIRRHRELETQREEEQKRRNIEKERDNRLLSREKRLRERELRRSQRNEELSQLSDNKNSDSAAVRISERHRLAEIEKTREALRELAAEGEEEWVFDCICGLYGKVDDGQHSVSCERCNIWQHSECLGIDKAEADKDDFHFICSSCRHRLRVATQEADANATAESRQPVNKAWVSTPTPSDSAVASQNGVEPPSKLLQAPANDGAVNVPTHVSTHAALYPTLQAVLEPPQKDPPNASVIPVKPAGPSVPHSSPLAYYAMQTSGASEPRGPNPLPSVHLDLSQPLQSPTKARAYGTIYERVSPAPQNGDILGSEPGAPIASVVTTQTSPPTALSQQSSNGSNRQLVTALHFSEEPRATASKSSPSPQTSTRPEPRPLTAMPAPIGSVAIPKKSPLRTPVHSSFPTEDRAAIKHQWAKVAAATPRLQYPREDGRALVHSEQTPSPLLPSQGGLSPTKHSPMMNTASAVFPDSNPIPHILPPTAALSPSTPKHIFMPPVKHEAPAQR